MFYETIRNKMSVCQGFLLFYKVAVDQFIKEQDIDQQKKSEWGLQG